MTNFAEMFGLGPGPTNTNPDDERRRHLLELLTQANQPEQAAEIPVPRQQSMSGNLADSILAGLADGFISAGGGHSNYSAVDALQRRREDRQQREDYNAQAKAKNAGSSKRAAAAAEATVLGGEMQDARTDKTRRLEQEAIRQRQAEDDARRVGVEVRPGSTPDEINAQIAKAHRDQIDAGKTTIYEERANDLLNRAASDRVTLPPGLEARMRKGEDAAFYEARNAIAKRPETADGKRDDRLEKDQDERLDEAMDSVDTMISGKPATEKDPTVVESARVQAEKGVSLKEIWKAFQRNNARLRLDDKRTAEAEKFFWTYFYPEYMDAYQQRFNAQSPVARP